MGAKFRQNRVFLRQSADLSHFARRCFEGIRRCFSFLNLHFFVPHLNHTDHFCTIFVPRFFAESGHFLNHEKNYKNTPFLLLIPFVFVPRFEPRFICCRTSPSLTFWRHPRRLYTDAWKRRTNAPSTSSRFRRECPSSRRCTRKCAALHGT